MRRFDRQLELEERAKRFYEMTFIAERPQIALDLVRFVCGDFWSGGGSRIGGGQSRAVYDFLLIPGTVIKITSDPSSNMNEWEMWKAVRAVQNYNKWFAPCLSISPTGHFLIQKKVRPLRKSDKLPKKLPALFTDIKRSNWGFIGKRLVCHDYQHLDNAISSAMEATRAVTWGRPGYTEIIS